MLIISCFAFSGDKNKVQKLVQMAWTFVNDRLDCKSFIHSFPTMVLYLNFFVSESIIFFVPIILWFIQLLPYMHISIIIVN